MVVAYERRNEASTALIWDDLLEVFTHLRPEQAQILRELVQFEEWFFGQELEAEAERAFQGFSRPPEVPADEQTSVPNLSETLSE